MYLHKDVSQTPESGLGLHTPSAFQSDISYPNDLSSLGKGSVMFVCFCRRLFKNVDLGFHLAELSLVSVKLPGFVSHSVIQGVIQEAETKSDTMKT